MKTLYLAWQAPTSRAWFPIGRLDADPPHNDFRFRYTGGALNAEKGEGFQPLYSFPKFNDDYRASELFPLFENRVLGQNRREYPDFLDWLGLNAQDADPLDILAVSGGERATDNLEVFPRIEKSADNSFKVRFFAHGLRHLSVHSQTRAATLKAGDNLRVMVELNNPATRLAISLLSDDYYMIGWTPRYLVPDFLECIVSTPLREASIVKVNPSPAPAHRRLLLELSGKMPPEHEPMSTPDFRPLV